ncbi:hypothetical protein SISNIDRAFT_465196 [Sistotremastrum niveocremeum HHB9708]|uniref:Uncharacterized protein n=1 Tax=Sistotremastrum niveocremeum HHB9708 TaxID=1314777 RepID=A0A164WDG2_9AGAM|nr:hypothetical protein SISNIDRAFT_465196 [Sistotremastrum niveocremeum HHB9708]
MALEWTKTKSRSHRGMRKNQSLAIVATANERLSEAKMRSQCSIRMEDTPQEFSLEPESPETETEYWFRRQAREIIKRKLVFVSQSIAPISKWKERALYGLLFIKMVTKLGDSGGATWLCEDAVDSDNLAGEALHARTTFCASMLNISWIPDNQDDIHITPDLGKA